MPVPQPVHKYTTRYKKLLNKFYNDVGPYIIADHSHKTPEGMTYHQYLNIKGNSIIDDKTGGSLQYRHIIKRDKHKNTWLKSFSNKLVILVQGVGYILKGINTIVSLQHEKIPTYRRKDVTYDQIVCNFIPQKYEPQRTRLMAGGNLISFPGNISRIKTDITTEKILFNSTISTKGSRFL